MNISSSSFALPRELFAKEPPERRGIARDEVKLMIINRKNHQIDHARFYSLGRFLSPGDLLVFNASRTLPAVLKGCSPSIGSRIEVRLAEHLPDDSWLALLRCEKGDPFSCGLREGMQVNFSKELSGVVCGRDKYIQRLWNIRFSKSGAELMDILYTLGEPVRYEEYLSSPWDLDYYQTVYAREPGSAEMPSAGRAFTWRLIFNLKRIGVDTAYIVLHTGLSSYMDEVLDAKHPISEEEFFVSESTAKNINSIQRNGGRVIAVGTTVVRALESAKDGTGKVKAMHGYTRLHITAEYVLKVVDGLLTGLHEPEASHLDLLNAFIPEYKIHESYQEAIKRKYLWHEFGDLNLIL